MGISTSTLLDVVNRVLLDVGERSTIDLSRPAASKARYYVQDAFNDTQNFHEWEWLMLTQAVDTWSTDTGTLNNVRRIRNVEWDDGFGFYSIPYLDIDSFDYFDVTSFVGATETATRPTYWTKIDEDTIRLNPYPTDSTGQSKIKVKVVKYFNPPSATTDFFSCPERFINAITKRAVYMMYARHLGDMNAAQVLQGEFEAILNVYRSKEALVPTGGFNMYRGDRWR